MAQVWEQICSAWQCLGQCGQKRKQDWKWLMVEKEFEKYCFRE